jgi:large subunit ribosomal protein L23
MSSLKEQRLMTVLLGPIISEKSTMVGEKHNQYVFRVLDSATKPEVKAAIELLFSKKDTKIEVTNVAIVNVKGKEKRYGKFMGRRINWKKAYISVKAGQDINFAVAE